MSEVQVLHITVAAPLHEAYAFAHRPETFALWAAGLAQSLRHTPDGWVADTPDGEALVEFSPLNAFGVLDHWVRLPGRPSIYVPLRMVANGEETEVELVLFRQPGMTDAAFARDREAVRADLQSLKVLLEAQAGRSAAL